MTAEPADRQKILTDQPDKPTQAEKEESRAVSDFSQSATDQPTMHAKVYSPFQNYYDGQAFSVSAVNATGPFDILPRHHNFISLLSAGELIIRSIKGDDRRIRISGGIMHVKADRVIVFLDI